MQVLHAQAQHLDVPQSGAVKQLERQPDLWTRRVQDGFHLGPRQDDRETLPSLSPHPLPQFAEWLMQDLAAWPAVPLLCPNPTGGDTIVIWRDIRQPHFKIG